MWPTDAYDTDLWRIYNDEGVFMYHPAAAHSNGDTFVLFRGSDVISTGEIVNLTNYPVIDAERGGSINGLIDALNQMIDLMEPKEYEEGGTYIIPGHGHIGDRHDVVNYRDMVTIIRDRIKYLIGEGKTLEQVKAEKPTFDYDVLYGTTTGPWTTDMFIETVYRELSTSKNQKPGGGRE
jgi:glyoxylase-like metal-dependent hydrolase (beta-lactamase superfamily II)